MSVRIRRWIYIAVTVYIACTLMLWQLESGIYNGVPSEKRGNVFHIVFNPASTTTLNASSIRKTVDNGIASLKNLSFSNVLNIVLSSKGTCPGASFPDAMVTDSWVSIAGTDIYVYSAYYESVKNEVRVIAVRDRRKSSALHCHLWTANGTMSSNTATLQDLPEHKGKRYGCVYYKCKTEPNTVPVAVALSREKCGKSEHAFAVQHDKPVISRNFTVCVTPLNYQYSKAYELVEMIELNRILGANRIVFYNHTTSHNVDKVLNYYKKLGLVEVHKWNLPMLVDTWPVRTKYVEIHYFAQIAALHECLERHRYQSRYLVYQDLDEFIIPRGVITWTQMMSKFPQDKGSYMFRNTFFRKDYPDSTNFTRSSIAEKFKLVTLLKQTREAKIFTRKQRSKYIINPKNIEILGIHSVTRFRMGGREHFVEPRDALLHHYRNWENPDDKAPRQLDTRMMVYGDILMKKILLIWAALKDVPLGPL